MKIAKLKIENLGLPDYPGVYFFLGKKGKILYIGKATNLKDRVKSYMSKTVFDTRGPLIAKMLEEAKKIEFIETNSVLEALLLEASEIKKHQPIYNSKEKDDKSYNYVTFTKDDFPKVLITRGSGTYGPFPHGGELKEALKIIRKIFPYRDKCKLGQSKLCFNAQIDLCPGVCVGQISKKEYQKSIKHLTLFFEAKKSKLIKSLEQEMRLFTREQKFEEAEKVKKQIFALKHIQDIALLKYDLETGTKNLEANFRIEAYDIAHISGTHTVGVMTVVENSELNKNQYRKFKIHLGNNNDIANLKEVLTRRFAHLEWKFPNLIVVDGGRGQINVTKEVLKRAGLNIAVVSVVKDDRHRAREILNSKGLTLNTNPQGQTLENLEKSILLANSEAHRFAIQYHRKLRGKGFGPPRLDV